MTQFSRASRTVLLTGAALFGVCGVAFASDADDADKSHVDAMRYVALDAQGDNGDSRQFSLSGSFSIGNHVWLQGLAGKLTDSNPQSLGDMRNFGVGGGFRSEHFGARVNFSEYKNDATYRQRDISGTLSWYSERVSIGIDLFRRKTDTTADTTQAFPTLGLTNVALHFEESYTGKGYGAHVDVNITDALSLTVGGMSYSYDSEYELTSSSNPLLIRRLLARRPTITELLYLRNSGVTRSLALLDTSYNAGLQYSFDTVSLALDYLRDSALDTSEITNTAMLSAAISLGDHWQLVPSLGYTKPENADSIAFGGLSVSYNF